MSATCDFTLAELMIVAASEAWRGNGEVIASGLGVIPRLGASLAKLTHSPELLMTDSETFLVEEPIPRAPRGDPNRPLGTDQLVLRQRLSKAQDRDPWCARFAGQQHQPPELVFRAQPQHPGVRQR